MSNTVDGLQPLNLAISIFYSMALVLILQIVI